MILLVEDSPDDEAVMMHALRESRVPVEVTRDGAEAIDYLRAVGEAKKPRPDVVLLDMNLPRVKGLDVLRQIRALPHTRDVPVVVLTSSGKPGDLARSYELGANSFVGKPPDARRFEDAIRMIARYWVHRDPAETSDGVGPP